MLNARTLLLITAIGLLGVGAASAQTLEENWNDFLHYTLIGRFDMAEGFARAILESKPDPVELLALSDVNPQGYALLSRAKENRHRPKLAQLSAGIWDIVEQGRFIRRSDPEVVVQEVKRLTSTERGKRTAIKRLRNAGEYAIPFMIDALADRSRKQEWPNIVEALPKIGRPAIRPLVAALQTKNVQLKAEIVKALGRIGYQHPLAYLKFVVEKGGSAELRELAGRSIVQLNPTAAGLSAADLFYRLAEQYYYHTQSLAPPGDARFANIWFWDYSRDRLIREKVDKDYFNELMAMRACEWALKADPAFGHAIGLWLAAYFKAESYNIEVPKYFGDAHADAFVYATTAGPEYLHQALARAVKDKNPYVALATIEALAVNAGEKSLLYRLGTAQPLVQALSFDDRAVRYSAAIAIAAAGPKQRFPESIRVVDNLAQALRQMPDTAAPDTQRWNDQLADSYAVRAATVMLKLAQTRNPVIDLSSAERALITATADRRAEIQVLAGRVLAHINTPDAQRAIAAMALRQQYDLNVRVKAFESLAVSAKLNASLLDEGLIDAIYSLVGSLQTDPALRSAAAAAYGALNLPSQKVKDLILDQAKT